MKQKFYQSCFFKNNFLSDRKVWSRREISWKKSLAQEKENQFYYTKKHAENEDIKLILFDGSISEQYHRIKQLANI